ncbi:MAG: NAD(P)-binding oxidoreductase [Myxococcota bacterium]
MKLIVFGATGGLGQWVWKAAVDAGHEVVTFVRTPSKLDSSDPRHAKLRVVSGDVMNGDAVREAATGSEVAINCTSPAGGNSTIDLARSVVSNASAGGVQRFYMVGGVGALWAPETNKQVLVQDWDDAEAMQRYGLSPSIPREMIQKMTKGHLESMAYLESTGLPHAFLCPGRMQDGPASDSRVVTLDELGGQSAMLVNFGDIAQVIADDLERGELIGHRVCVSAE